MLIVHPDLVGSVLFVTSEEWPPSSPDLNPMDYCIWGILEANVNARNASTRAALQKIVAEEWEKLSMDTVRAAIASWPKRIRACISKQGGRFEE
jgi:hypothetical protein